MTTFDDVLPPLPYEDAPTSRLAPERPDDGRGLDDKDSPTRELSPDVPPSGEYEGDVPLMGSPSYRGNPPLRGERGLEPDTSRLPATVDEEGQSKDVPDVLVPTLPVRPEPVLPATDAQTALRISEMVTMKELATLKAAITELYERVTTELASNSAKAALALGWLSEARTIGLGRPEQFPVAELRVAQTRTLLEQYRQSHSAGSRNARTLVAANLFWLALFGILFFTDQWVQAGGIGASLRAVSTVFPPWLSVLAGGHGWSTGGVGRAGAGYQPARIQP